MSDRMGPTPEEKKRDKLAERIESQLKKVQGNLDLANTESERQSININVWGDKVSVLRAAHRYLYEQNVDLAQEIKNHPRYNQQWSFSSGWQDSSSSTTEALLNEVLKMRPYNAPLELRREKLERKIQLEIIKLQADMEKYPKDKKSQAVWADKVGALKAAIQYLHDEIKVDALHLALQGDYPRCNQEYSYLSGWSATGNSKTDRLLLQAMSLGYEMGLDGDVVTFTFRGEQKK
jgi:hypothetical protein